MAEKPKLNRRSSSSLRKGSSKPESSSKYKTQIENLTQENASLKKELEKLYSENKTVKENLSLIVDKVVGSLVEEEKENYDFTEMTDLLDIPTEDVLDIISKMVTKKLKWNKNSIEARIEDTETRITEQSIQLANLLKTRSILEEGLHSLLQCSTIFQVKQIVEDLQFAIQTPVPMSSVNNDNPPVCTQHIPDHQGALLDNLEKTDSLQPPSRHMPGDTHIKFMRKELRTYIANTLSLERNSKQDWRTMAVRVGVPMETIDKWTSLNHPCPMNLVFSFWTSSDAATVRMLHRHLASPQMKSLMLAKQLASFYEVD